MFDMQADNELFAGVELEPVDYDSAPDLFPRKKRRAKGRCQPGSPELKALYAQRWALGVDIYTGSTICTCPENLLQLE